MNNDAIDSFIDNLLSGKKRKTSVLDQLYKRPNKDTNGDETVYAHISPNYIQQIDVLTLPNDKGYSQCLVIADNGSRLCDAAPLKSRNPEDVIAAIKTIYKRKILGKPKVLKSDSGTEFKGKVEQYLASIGIDHAIAKPRRSKQVAIVERKNQTIGKIIHKMLLTVDLETEGENASSQWIEYLPKIITKINGKVKESNIKPDDIHKHIPDISFNPEHKIDLLSIGQDVRVALDKPQDVNGKPKYGSFRSGDIRWNPEVRTIRYVISKPDQPIMYLLNGKVGDLRIEPVGYTRNQLQTVSTREKEPEAVVPVEHDRYEFEKILERKVEGRKAYYLIKWKNSKKKDSTWEPRSELMKDIPQAVLQWEKKNKINM
jgi:hypothetical protein